MTRLDISKELFERMIAHCLSVYPNEACGILAGKDRTVKKIYEMTNIENSPVSYMMDPKEQFGVMKEMRNEGDDMLAIYHSHPDSASYPSAKDREIAYYSNAVYVIVSLIDPKRPDVKAYEINEGEVNEAEVCLQPC
jgi:proteasome lid subunit RPN8/RPN11